jgi:holo-[acyl-carrier protein] synthase
MYVNCGTDLIRISRIENAVQKHGARFLNRIWTAREQKTAAAISSLAVRFAAKEAVAKALGSGIGPFGVCWTDIEILRASNGAPEIHLHGAAGDLFKRFAGMSISVSLSHEGDLAQAFCVMLSMEPVNTANIGEEFQD